MCNQFWLMVRRLSHFTDSIFYTPEKSSKVIWAEFKYYDFFFVQPITSYVSAFQTCPGTPLPPHLPHLPHLTHLIQLSSLVQIARLELGLSDEGDIQNVQWWGGSKDRFERHCYSIHRLNGVKWYMLVVLKMMAITLSLLKHIQQDTKQQCKHW